MGRKLDLGLKVASLQTLLATSINLEHIMSSSAARSSTRSCTSQTVRPARRARDTKPAATPRLTAALLSAAGSRRVSGRGLHEARATARVARDQLVQVTVLRVSSVKFWELAMVRSTVN